MFRLVVKGPKIAKPHLLIDEDGIAYARDFTSRKRALPRRFSGPARPSHAAGPPFTTIVFGLETGRFDMRARFLETLREDARAGRPLVSHGNALESAFRLIFGGRGATADTPGFLTWLRGAIGEATSPEERDQLVRGMGEREGHVVDEHLAKRGVRSVVFNSETGHMPSDHPEVLYWISDLVPDWKAVHFDQLVDTNDDELGGSYHLLQAWYAGQELQAPAQNLGDFLDVHGCAGLANRILRDVLHSDVRIWAHEADDVGQLVAGTLPAIRELVAAGVIGQPREYDGD